MAKMVSKRDPNALEVATKPNEDNAAALARTVLQPNVQAAVTLREYDKKFGHLDLTGMAEALKEHTKATMDGDMGRAEAVLIAQAHTLDAIYNNLARRAINSEFMNHLDSYLKLALRAQSQCRATWEALSAVKHPPIQYVKQLNMANNQQVNNGTRENPSSPTGLSGDSDELCQDPGTPGIEKKDDPPLEAVGEVNRAKNS